MRTVIWKAYMENRIYYNKKMNTDLIRTIIASNIPRKEQDILILLVIDNMFHEQDSEEHESDAESDAESD